MKVTKIISKLLESNVFVVEKEGHFLIVDCGVELSQIKKIVGQNRVDGILLTHGHYDHSLYCNEYAKAFKTKIYAEKSVQNTIIDGRANYSDGGFSLNDFSRFVFIDEDCKLKIGDFEVECILSKGHSPCCICFKIDDSLFAGDFLFENGIGRTDLINSNKQDMLDSLNKIENVDFKQVYSGHGVESDKKTQQKNIAIFKRFLQR